MVMAASPGAPEWTQPGCMWGGAMSHGPPRSAEWLPSSLFPLFCGTMWNSPVGKHFDQIF